MSIQSQKIAEMYDMLPDKEKDLAYEMVKRIVLAWDPDYTKLTPTEASELAEAENGEYIDAENIDWDNLDKY